MIGEGGYARLTFHNDCGMMGLVWFAQERSKNCGVAFNLATCASYLYGKTGDLACELNYSYSWIGHNFLPTPLNSWRTQIGQQTSNYY